MEAVYLRPLQKTGWAKGAEKQNVDYNEEGRTQIGMRISCQEYR